MDILLIIFNHILRLPYARNFIFLALEIPPTGFNGVAGTGDTVLSRERVPRILLSPLQQPIFFFQLPRNKKDMNPGR